MKTLSIYAFVFLTGIAIAQAVYYFPVMPETMATHFGFGGEPNGYASRNSFFIFEAILLLIVVLSFAVMPLAFEKFKVRKSLNLPNKDYWTAPERIDLVYEYFRKSFGWFGTATMLLLIGTLQLTFEANLLPKPILDENKFLIIFAGYILFVIVWMISFYRKFSKTE